MVSDIFDPAQWDVVPGFAFEDITYHRAKHQGTGPGGAANQYDSLEAAYGAVPNAGGYRIRLNDGTVTKSTGWVFALGIGNGFFLRDRLRRRRQGDGGRRTGRGQRYVEDAVDSEDLVQSVLGVRTLFRLDTFFIHLPLRHATGAIPQVFPR